MKFGIGAALLAVAVATSCAQAPPPVPSEQPIAPPPQASAQFGGGQREVIEDYTAFWKVTRRLPQRPPERWRPELEQVAAGTMAETILDNLALQRDRGITLYGEVHQRITDVRLTGDSAVVTDCQDSSGSGQADAVSGEPKTAGVARNAVSGTVERGPDGTWRVTRIDYPQGGC
ncbi:hypothetical protein OOZ19_04280 [Saccharopolyspora sp. NFXS83]|uniref:hypothetical protein n=1 Tax=Saccharopolyspora sp. NFXS83 TaxID=2993560 RepID=UPI00224ABC1F|nr:hypothetical protein [Saccharopolyspora sp. NFXS83]MCX2729446.1 hypothetical protein [Saccharopolyspora sp. NFXS83]